MTTALLQKILYAEDEPDIQEIAKIALEDVGGFTVKHCMNGKEVLAMLRDFEPDLFLLDVMMPEMDGPMVLKELRKIPRFMHTPVIFMTAKIQAAELDEYKKLGVLDIIKKPFDPMLLANMLRASWNKVK